MCFFSLQTSALFSRYKETAYLHSGMRTTAERGENSRLWRDCLESNILSSKWRRCCSCGACGDSAGGWIPSPPPASCNNSVPFSPLNDHSLNGLISVGAHCRETPDANVLARSGSHLLHFCDEVITLCFHTVTECK